MLGILQTPHRFRTKRPLWNYGGLAIEMHGSADHRRVDGQRTLLVPKPAKQNENRWERTPKSLGHSVQQPSTWRGRSEQISLHPVD
jgi:hypothetical protein